MLAHIGDGIAMRQAELRSTPSSTSFRVVLHPQSLGEVAVHVERSAAGLVVTLAPQHAATQALLDRHVSDLAGVLRGMDGHEPVVSVIAPAAHASSAGSAFGDGASQGERHPDAPGSGAPAASGDTGGRAGGEPRQHGAGTQGFAVPTSEGVDMVGGRVNRPAESFGPPRAARVEGGSAGQARVDVKI